MVLQVAQRLHGPTLPSGRRHVGWTSGFTDEETVQTLKAHADSSDTDDAPTDDPSPVLALATVGRRLLPKMEVFFFFEGRSLTVTHGSFVSQSSRLLAETCSLRCPLRDQPPGDAPIRSHEFDPHNPRRQLPSQQQHQQQQPARSHDPSSRHAQSSTASSPLSESHDSSRAQGPPWIEDRSSSRPNVHLWMTIMDASRDSLDLET